MKIATVTESAEYSRLARLDDALHRLRTTKLVMCSAIKAMKGVGLKNAEVAWTAPDTTVIDAMGLQLPVPDATWFETEDLDDKYTLTDPIDQSLSGASEAVRLFRLARHHRLTAEAVWGVTCRQIQDSFSWLTFEAAWKLYGDLCRIGMDADELTKMKRLAAKTPQYKALLFEARDITMTGRVIDAGSPLALTTHAGSGALQGAPSDPWAGNISLFRKELETEPTEVPSVVYEALVFIQQLWDALDSIRTAMQGAGSDPSYHGAGAGELLPLQDAEVLRWDMPATP